MTELDNPTGPEAQTGSGGTSQGPIRSFRDRVRRWIREEVYIRDGIGNPLQELTDDELKVGLRDLETLLKGVEFNELDRAAQVAADGPAFLDAARMRVDGPDMATGAVQDNQDLYEAAQGGSDLRRRCVLTDDEAKNLVKEAEELFSHTGMLAVISTIATAAFLQGHVQSSINGASLYASLLGARDSPWQVGAMNASIFLAAALIGAPFSLVTNYYIGRRGSLLACAVLIIASSVGAAAASNWIQVLGARIVGGVGMGIKAVSAPILASETAVGFWRGSTVLTWQLWVACGIMTGLAINLAIADGTHALDAGGLRFPNGTLATHESDAVQKAALRYILGAPIVPGVILLIVVCFCYESPRYYLRAKSPSYDPDRALEILMKLRKSKLQALRDLILIWWSEVYQNNLQGEMEKPTLTYASQLKVVLDQSWEQYSTLFLTQRLRNAVWSTGTVALAQQLCGINVFAFYSNTMFVGVDSDASWDPNIPSGSTIKSAMLYSLGFGLVNFVFCIPAIKSIDVQGRRVWLLWTLPAMAIFLMVAALFYQNGSNASHAHQIAGKIFIYLFAAAYSPGLGPITFTLASESFPLSHREAGTSVAIMNNLFFAGLLTILLPSMNSRLKPAGTIGFFSGMNLVAFVLILFCVEETKQYSLEDLENEFKQPKAHIFLDPFLVFLQKHLCKRREGAPRENGATELHNIREPRENGGGVAAQGSERNW